MTEPIAKHLLDLALGRLTLMDNEHDPPWDWCAWSASWEAGMWLDDDWDWGDDVAGDQTE